MAVCRTTASAMLANGTVLAQWPGSPLTALLCMFELTHDIPIVLPLMAATGLQALIVGVV